MDIKSKRLEKGLTQENLAVIVGVGRTAIAMWEAGKSIPRAEKLPKLAEVLGCTIDELYAERAG